VLMVTHERDYDHYFDRTISLADGSISNENNLATRSAEYA